MSNAEPTCWDGFSIFKIIFLKIQKLQISHYKNVIFLNVNNKSD